MKNYRGGGSKHREVVTAAAARTSGQAVVEQGFTGVAETTANPGDRYVIRRDGEFDFAVAGTPNKGDDVLIGAPPTFTLSTAAHAASPPAGLFGRVSATPTDPNTGSATDGYPATGHIWVTIGSGGAGA
jgi:predicted RecA/RadA family phage recombinase